MMQDRSADVKTSIIPEDAAVGAPLVQLRDYYRMLLDSMPEFFFRSLGDRISEILPLMHRLGPDSGVRRAAIGRDVFLLYYRGDDNHLSPVERGNLPEHLAAAMIHRARKPALFDGKPYFLTVEHYSRYSDETTAAKVSCDDLLAAYRELYGDKDIEALKEIYTRVRPAAVNDLDAGRLAQRLHVALEAQRSDYVAAELDNDLRLTVSLAQPVPQPDLFKLLIEAVDLAAFVPGRLYFRELTSGGDPEDFSRQPVMVATLYLEPRGGMPVTEEMKQRLLTNVRLINHAEMDDMFHFELVRRHGFAPEDAHFLRAAAEFAHSQLAFVDRNAFNYDDIFRFLALYPTLSARLAAEFRRRFDPAGGNGRADDLGLILESVEKVNSGDPDKDQIVKGVFRAVADFVANIRKTNFFCPQKAALAFRLSPDFMDFYRGMAECYGTAFPAAKPHGVFFFYRRRAIGYHVRFSEIARGGWRTVIPERASNALERFDNYAAAKDELFREVFVLAHTQHLKNKDIYEGGAKMITLLEPVDRDRRRPALWQAQRGIFLAFLSLINSDTEGKLRDKSIVDHLGSREIIEIGPDENMFDPMILWMGEYAAHHGYTLGSGIISGKPGAGINHKEYGVTSFGVHQFLLKTLEDLGINPEKDAFSVKISGGPAGDVAGNEMKLLLARKADGSYRYPKLKIVAVTDGPAAIYDPAGIDREELAKLLFVSALDVFPAEKLSGEGAYMLLNPPDGTNHVKLLRHKGALERIEFERDEFLRLFQLNLTNYADVFIPAGGRPSTINEANYLDYFPANQPSFRAIVEGANSFITPKAREAIQSRGVRIVKDASANKCGVITSSYEILTGLMLSDAEFRAIKPELVPEVMEILRSRARREADWLYARFRAEGTMLTRLTDRLSNEINDANGKIAAFLAENPDFVTDGLIRSHLPPLFSGRYADRISRLPREYRRAIASVELACRLVYQREDGSLGRQLLALLTPEELPQN
ncbi:MAG: NAD-glutamate dehydrogenase domain-containing protein [Victivallaceae bacterium]